MSWADFSRRDLIASLFGVVLPREGSGLNNAIVRLIHLCCLLAELSYYHTNIIFENYDERALCAFEHVAKYD